ncbi:MAG: hypothetical protein K0R65_294 [Crocinitomicaceae bacterium]|jgi:beta-mannosidase|nr:hypothetical protein [Crocinitomicaceae bacterium]
MSVELLVQDDTRFLPSGGGKGGGYSPFSIFHFQFSIAFSGLLSFILSLSSFAQHEYKLEWQFIHPESGKVIPLGEKGTVQGKLIETGELPDPFYGENEKEFTWIEHYSWVFESELKIKEEDLAFDFLELEFPSIDTYAGIYINDSLLTFTDNAFYTHRFQVKNYLKAGKNAIKIVFMPPVLYHRAAYDKRKSQLPSPNDVGEIAVASMSRKPQYQFGWDWALRMNTIGFWKPARLRTYNSNRLTLAKIETKSIVENRAALDLDLQFSVKSSEEYRVESELFGVFNVKSKEGKIKIPLSLSNPKLWWPRGHGEAYLYHDNLLIYNLKGDLISTKELSFGVRTSELVQNKDKWGTSFYFKINGKAIFCKGANMIPQDVFPSRVKDADIIKLVQEAYDANMNMIRVWGGGYYQDELFYQNCDEKGILVWQDFMFACAMYPGDPVFLASVEKELNFQVPRLAAHPSVVYFNGNNEVDVAWKNWGFQLKYLIGPKTQEEIEADYKKLFQQLAPRIVKENSYLPYVHTSPLSNWGKDEYFNHGTMHYWGVWHGKDPIEDFGLKSGRFNAEYGFQSFPEFSTLSSFSREMDWDLNSSVMKHHQKSYVGNGMIKKHADILYGNAFDFKEFVYFSQLTQAKAVGIAIAGHRTDMPRCMGTLFWQLNDCWPAPTWSSIDYYNNWKALHYQARADYENVAVLERTQKLGEEKYVFLSDIDTAFTSTVSYRIFDLSGKVLFENYFNINTKGRWNQEIALECQTKAYRDKNYVIAFSWTNEKGESEARTFYHEAKKAAKAERSAFTFEIQNIDEEQKTAVIKLTSTRFLANCWISSQKRGVRFDRNFEHLLPGEHIFHITFEEIPKAEDFEFFWR